MKKLSFIIVAFLVVLVCCKKTPQVNIQYVDIEREVLTIGATTANVQCDYEYIATLKSAKLYYGRSESNMHSVNMRVVQSVLYAEIDGLSSNTTYRYYYEFENGFNSMQSEVKTFTTEESPTTVVSPTVVTSNIAEITAESAVGGGEVTSDGGGDVTARGVCWSTSPNPTLSDSFTTDGTGIGSFVSNLTGLSNNTTYHVRAYATNEAGTAYGLDKEFTTLNGGGSTELPTVITSDVTGITSHSAICGGNVTSDGNGSVIARGICWSTSPNPTTADSFTTDGSGLGSFASSITGLSNNTTYHVRAYATNEAGTAYGLDKEFTSLNGGGGGGDAPTGAINGLFTINENGDQVYFSQGNLQYQASTNTWRFAEHQWDFVGGTVYGQEYGTVYEDGVKCDNTLISQSYSGWIDLFGWATSGWNNNNHYYQPWDKESTGWVIDGYGYGYWDGEYSDYSMFGDYANMDWGVYNAISNGGNLAGLWRAGGDVIYYVINNRQNHAYLQSNGTVNGVEGKILLPDAWVLPEGVSFLGSVYDYETNNYSIAEWEIMESAGAVFLPKAGLRYTGIDIYHYNDTYYWGQHSRGIESGAANVWSLSDYAQGSPKYFGCSVRLIHDANK